MTQSEDVYPAVIQVLPFEEARKIAAGEVIDRPASLVREFIDNSIDAKAMRIEVLIEDGGVKKTEVRDNGFGMTRADLAAACLTHATSKIRSFSDLDIVRTLGFRGEALAAISAVSLLEIITSTDGRKAWRLEARPEVNIAEALNKDSRIITPALRVRGTTVRAKNLFDSIPARKQFLKKSGAEGSLCRQVFIEKALAFEAIEFRFFVEDKLKLAFTPVETKKERFCACVPEAIPSFVHEINAAGQDFSVSIVMGGPELSYSDRRRQFIFANGRRIVDFSFQQALEFGAQGWFPNGTHPMCAIFIDVDPKFADFNIHPAKKEARFKQSAEIHHAISSAVTRFTHGISVNVLHSLTFNLENTTTVLDDFLKERVSGDEDGKQNDGGESRNEACADGFCEVKPPSVDCPDILEHSVGRKNFLHGKFDPETGLSFYGYLFGLFLLVSDGENFYIIDQHAAHERILYEKFILGGIERQPLLAPIHFFSEDSQDDDFLLKKAREMENFGVIIKEAGAEHSWIIEELPLLWKLSDGETVREILNLKNTGENFTKRWAATIACHAAIKDGDVLSEDSATRLASQAIDLHIHRCPHGRPILTVIRKKDLLKAVRR
jgi:DNA mismatch repair protein MutL